jgi:hypothetical protein
MSILMPAFQCRALSGGQSDNKKKKKSILQKIEKTVEKQLGLENRNDYELFALVPLSSLNKEDLYDNIKKYNNPEIAIRLNDSSKFISLKPQFLIIDLSLRTLEDILVCKEKSQHLMQKNNEALLQYVDEIKNLRNLILTDIQEAKEQPSPQNSSNMSNNRENILRKALKCKQLEDDNKKLRKLLKTQIENSEQLR